MPEPRKKPYTEELMLELPAARVRVWIKVQGQGYGGCGSKVLGEHDDRCHRWRKIAIDQLFYTLNLTLTFTIAALGFWFALLKGKDFNPVSGAKSWMWASLAGLAISAFVGFICALCRLWDFRGTARRACEHLGRPYQG